MTDKVKFINGHRQIATGEQIYIMSSGKFAVVESWTVMTLFNSLKVLINLYGFKFFIKFEILPGAGFFWKRLYFTINIEYKPDHFTRSELFRANIKGMLLAIDCAMMECADIQKKLEEEYLG